MNSPLVLRKIGWHVRHGLGKFGLPGIIGLGVFAFCLAFYFSTLEPEKRKLDELRHEMALFHARFRASEAIANKTPLPLEQLSTFYNFFPRSGSMPEELAKLYEAAQAHGLTLSQGEYRLTRDRGSKLMRYEITLPIKGDYPQIRKFLAQVLNDMPNISLDSLNFQRQKVGETAIESQIKLTLFLREG